MNVLNTPFAMKRGELLRLENAAGHVVQVRQGSLWITQDRDVADHVVQAGSSFLVRAGGRTLVSALQSSLVEVCRASEPAPVRLTSAIATAH
jgi:hypothetical protein